MVRRRAAQNTHTHRAVHHNHSFDLRPSAQLRLPTRRSAINHQRLLTSTTIRCYRGSFCRNSQTTLRTSTTGWQRPFPFAIRPLSLAKPDHFPPQCPTSPFQSSLHETVLASSFTPASMHHVFSLHCCSK